MVAIVFGITVFLSLFIPTKFFLTVVFGSAYARMIDAMSIPGYVAFNLVQELLPPLVITLVFLRKSELMGRVPDARPGSRLLLIGAIAVVAPQLLRLVLSLTDDSADAMYAVLGLAVPLVAMGKLMLVAGAFRLLLAAQGSKDTGHG